MTIFTLFGINFRVILPIIVLLAFVDDANGARNRQIKLPPTGWPPETDARIFLLPAMGWF